MQSLVPYVTSGPLVRFSPTGRWLVAIGGDDTQARLWEVSGADPIQPSLLEGGGATVVEHHGHTYVVTRPSEQRALVWDLAADDPRDTPIDVPDALTNANMIRLTPNRQWLIASVPLALLLWDVADRAAPARPLLDLATSANELEVTPDSRWLLVAHSGQIGYGWLSRWDLNDPNPTRYDLGVVNGSPLLWRSDGQVVAASDGIGVFRAWRVPSGGETIYTSADEQRLAEAQADDFLLFPGDRQGPVTIHDAVIRIWPGAGLSWY